MTTWTHLRSDGTLVEVDEWKVPIRVRLIHLRVLLRALIARARAA